MWLGTIAHSFLPSHIHVATKHARPKAQLRRAHGLRPADADARVAPMPWQLRPAAPPGASSGVRRRPDRRGRSPGYSSDPRREAISLGPPNPPSPEPLAHAREWRHYPAVPESSGHIPNGPACDAGDPTTPNGFLAPHDARTGSIRPGSRHRAPKRHCPVRARHGALSSPRFPLCDPGVAAVPWRRAARCSQLLRTRRRSVAIHSTWKAAVRTAVD